MTTWMSKKTLLCRSWPRAWIKVFSILCQFGRFNRNIICNFYLVPHTALLHSCLQQLTSFKNNNVQASEHRAITSPDTGKHQRTSGWGRWADLTWSLLNEHEVLIQSHEVQSTFFTLTANAAGFNKTPTEHKQMNFQTVLLGSKYKAV